MTAGLQLADGETEGPPRKYPEQIHTAQITKKKKKKRTWRKWNSQPLFKQAVSWQRPQLTLPGPLAQRWVKVPASPFPSAEPTTWMLEILKNSAVRGWTVFIYGSGVNTPRTNTQLTFEQVSLLITSAGTEPNKNGCPSNREGRGETLNLSELFWGGNTHRTHQEIKNNSLQLEQALGEHRPQPSSSVFIF